MYSNTSKSSNCFVLEREHMLPELTRNGEGRGTKVCNANSSNKAPQNRTAVTHNW